MYRKISLFLLLALYSCSDSPSEIGADFFQDGVLDVSIVDSVSVDLSTITFENIITSNATRILAGHHEDAKLGKLTANPFFRVSVNGTSSLDESNTSYNYLALILKYDGYSFYDTLITNTYRVYRVADEIETENGYLYNTDTFSTDAEPLGTISFSPRPHRDDSLEIRLSDTLGKDLFLKAQGGGTALTDVTEFYKYLPGISVMPDTGENGCIIGFALASELRLYYTDKSITPSEEKYLSFPISSSASANTYFTRITADRTNTELTGLTSSETRLPSSETSDQSYCQSGTGLTIRVDFPYLKDLNQFRNFYINKAILEIYPVKRSYDELMPLPEYLQVYKINKRNEAYEEFSNSVVLIEDTDLGRDSYYYLDVTDFINEQLTIQEFNENGLMLWTGSENLGSTIDRLYLSAQTREYNTRLKIYYVTINN